mgnify:FL=1
MKKNLIGIGIFFIIFLFVGLSVIPFENWTNLDSYFIMFIIFSVICGIYLIGLIVFVILNRKKKIIEVVEFSAPDGMTPADAGYVIDKSIDDRDISSLLIYWAEKKYIEIIQNEDKTVILKKLKDADDKMKVYEQTMFNTVFSQKVEINLKDLPVIIKPITSTIKKQIKDENNKKYFNSKIESTSTWLTLGITCLLVFLSYFFGSGGTFSIICGVIIFAISTIFSNICNKVYIQKKLKAIILYIVGIVLFLIFALLNLVYSFTNLYVLGLITITTFLCLLTYILCPFLEYRTKEGQFVVGRLLGLKKYLEVTEKEKIEMLIKENPEYFYNIIPYAYVLNVSNEWIENYNFVKTINKKERNELIAGISLLTALFIFGEGFSIIGELFSGTNTKTKKKK